MSNGSMRRPTWRSSLLVGLCSLVFGFAVVFGVITILVLANSGLHHQFHLTFEVLVRTDLQRLPGNLIPERLTARADLEDLPAWLFYLSFCRTLAVTAVGLFGIWQAWMLARDIEVQEPFTATNARRLRLIGLIVLVGVPLRSIIGALLTRAALAVQVPLEPGVKPFWDLSTGSFIVALGVFVLAEVFARAANLREDVEGTV